MSLVCLQFVYVFHENVLAFQHLVQLLVIDNDMHGCQSPLDSGHLLNSHDRNTTFIQAPFSGIDIPLHLPMSYSG